MIAKFVAHAIVWLVCMFVLAKAIEFTDVVGGYVSEQVETGKVAAVQAPRMAMAIEYGVAGLLAFLLASSAPGIFVANWLAAKIDLVVAKLKTGAAGVQATGDAKVLTAADLDIMQLSRVLRDLRALAKDAQNRLTTLEKAAFGVKPDGNPAVPPDTSEQPAPAEVSVSISTDGISDQMKALVAKAVAESTEKLRAEIEASVAKPATRRSRSAQQA